MAKYSSEAYMNRTEALYGWAWLIIQLLFLSPLLSGLNSLLPEKMSPAELNFTFLLINFLAVLLIFRQYLADSVSQMLQHPAVWIQAVILGFCACFAANWSVTWLLGKLEPGFYNINDSRIVNLVHANRYLMTVGTVLLSPVAEECFFRGLIFRRLYYRSPWIGYAASMIAFSAVHLIAYIGSFSVRQLVLCFLQYLPAGLCLAWSYTKSDTIFAPIVIHGLINAWSIYSVR